MDLLLLSAFAAWCLMRAWGTAKAEHELAKHGQVPPRMAAKYGEREAARKVAKYGFTDYLRDAYNSYWSHRGEALNVARTAQPTEVGRRVRLIDRLRAGFDVVDAKVKAGAERLKAARQRKPQPAPEPPPAPLATDTGDVDPGTRRFTDDGGQEEWDGKQWKPAAAEPATSATSPAPLAAPVVASNPPTEGEPPMTAPTGEAVNYETTVNELEKLASEQRGHIDHCQEALRNIAAAKESINNMQESYRQSAAAAASTHEHLAAQNLDGTTLANTGTTADAMPAGAVDAMYDHLEEMEAAAKQRLADAEVALAATEAALDHVVKTYGDANETVAGNLGGDASFLNSGGPGVPAQGSPWTGAPAASQPAAGQSSPAAAGR